MQALTTSDLLEYQAIQGLTLRRNSGAYKQRMYVQVLWLNTAMKVMWPYYNQAIGQQVLEQANPIIAEQLKPVRFAVMECCCSPFGKGGGVFAGRRLRSDLCITLEWASAKHMSYLPSLCQSCLTWCAHKLIPASGLF